MGEVGSDFELALARVVQLDLAEEVEHLSLRDVNRGPYLPGGLEGGRRCEHAATRLTPTAKATLTCSLVDVRQIWESEGTVSELKG